MCLSDPIQHLINLRAKVAHHPPLGNYDWVPEDPVVRFAAPIFWYLKYKSNEQLSLSWQKARAQYWINVARFAVLRYHLERIVKEFQLKNVPFILLKGGLLAETLYNSPGFREMGDLDILVKQIHFPLVLKRLLELGWRHEHGDANPENLNAQLDGKSQWQMAEAALRDPKGNRIELHWHLVPNPWLRQMYHRVDLYEIWNHAVPLNDKNLKCVFSLSPVHNMAYLCLHIAQHTLLPLRAFLDIHQLIGELNSTEDRFWESFVRIVEKWHIRSAAFHVLSFSQYLFGTDIPKSVLKSIDPGPISKIWVKSLIRPKDLLISPPARFGAPLKNVVLVALTDRITYVTKLAIKIFMPEKSWRIYRYGRKVSLPHHWRHIWKMFWKGG